MNKIHFFKYQGTGNDFVIVDGRKKDYSELFTVDIVSRLCDRKFGIGADGLMILEDHPDYDFNMVYFNSDGRPSSMCGNGGRCLVAFAKKQGIERDKYEFMAIDGHHEAIISADIVELKMKDVMHHEKLGDDMILDTGSPHYLKWINDLSKLDVVANARAIRYSDRFSSVGINVNFIENADHGIQIRTYERGVEDETLSCGTGATAAAIAHAIENKFHGQQRIPVQVEGGHLEVKFERTEKGFENVWLCGPAEFVFEGYIEIGKLVNC